IDEASEFLRIRSLGNPWHVQESLWEGMDLIGNINGDIEITLARFKDRGISSGNQLIEAFITEHRGSQYINTQLLSCRASLDVFTPFGERDLLTLASRIPLATKVHNSL